MADGHSHIADTRLNVAILSINLFVTHSCTHPFLPILKYNGNRRKTLARFDRIRCR